MACAAIFDLDGTLIDTPNAIVQMMQNALAEMGHGSVDESRIRRMIGLPLEYGAASILGSQPSDDITLELVQLYRQQFLNWMVPKSSELIFPGVLAGLDTLQRAGIKIGLATSKYYSSAEAVLKSADIWNYFHAVAGSDTVTRQKPDSEMAELICAKLDCAPDRCVVIGDTVHDLKMGRSAGMRTIAVTYGVGDVTDFGSATPDWTAHTFDQVVTILMKFATPQITAA